MPQEEPSGTPGTEFVDRRVIFDRRLGERRVRTLPRPVERRGGGDRRQLRDRRESASAHLRNALQVVLCLAETGAADLSLEHTLRRLYLALAEMERLEQWARSLGQELRLARADGSSRPSS